MVVAHIVSLMHKCLKKSRKSLKKIIILALLVANGSIMRCDAYNPKFTWSMQRYEFQTDLRILKLGICDMMLEVN
jgi:hypothetical protein